MVESDGTVKVSCPRFGGFWFYVPDYGLIMGTVPNEFMYRGLRITGVQWGCREEDDRDTNISVTGPSDVLRDLELWLRESGIEGLMIEGRPVDL